MGDIRLAGLLHSLVRSRWGEYGARRQHCAMDLQPAHELLQRFLAAACDLEAGSAF